MNLRIMVGAFLTFGDKVLLIHRGTHKKIAPGMWSCIGGHMEPDELHDPIKTCYREIEEEAGISPEHIKNLQLRYITVRNTGEEIHNCYCYFGNTTHECVLPDCDEGSLHWVSLNDAPELEMSYSVKQLITHWLENPGYRGVMLCGTGRNNDQTTWTEL